MSVLSGTNAYHISIDELLICIEMDIRVILSIEYNGQMIRNNIWYIYVPEPIRGLKIKTKNSKEIKIFFLVQIRTTFTVS